MFTVSKHLRGKRRLDKLENAGSNYGSAFPKREKIIRSSDAVILVQFSTPSITQMGDIGRQPIALKLLIR